MPYPAVLNPLGAVLVFLLGALGAVAVSLAVADLRGWIPYVARRIASLGARRLPPGERKRYVEEWDAELDMYLDRPLTAIVIAFKIALSARRLALEAQISAGAEREQSESRARLAIKRTFDILGAALALILVLPLLAAIAVVIKLTSPGPVLVRQPRIGRGGNTFDLLTFRTSILDPEAGIPAQPTTVRAPGEVDLESGARRSTWVGRVLRLSYLDELPQLVNVLRGEMSLVKPSGEPTRGRDDNTEELR